MATSQLWSAAQKRTPAAMSSAAFCGRARRQNPVFHLAEPNRCRHHHPSSISTSPSLLRAVLTPISPLFSRPRPRAPPRLPRRQHATVRALFTGIVEEMGHVAHLGPSPDGDGVAMTVNASTVLGGVTLGDSIAVNGTCLTVTSFDHDASVFTVGLSAETLRRTNLGELRPGSPVNLERALRPDSRMGGHFVQGHVDGTGEIVGLDAEGDSLWVRVRAPPGVLRYVVPKGFVAVDGTSLTVVRVDDEEGWFNFVLVAYSQQKVVIPLKKVGDLVNLEVDILGKYVERLLKGGSGSGEVAAATSSSSSSG